MPGAQNVSTNEATLILGVSIADADAVSAMETITVKLTDGTGALAVNSAGAARALPTVGLVGLTVVVFGIGLTPTLLPLVALAIPPILVNTYAGVRQVDAQLRDAADGMGMKGWQVLFQVELPVALPLIILGLRTAAVQIVTQNSPGQFDPAVLEVFMEVAPKFETIFRETPD